MSSSKSDLLMKQFGRVNSAKQLTTDWDYSQSASALDSDETEERKLAVLIEWLNTILPDLKLPSKSSAEELRKCLADGTVLLRILKKVKPRSIAKEDGGLEGETVSPSQNVQQFLDSIDEKSIPKFEISDLEKGSMKRVVDCLLSIRVRYPTGRNNFSSSNGRMTRSGSLREFSPYQSLHLGAFSSSLSSPGAERQPLYSESKFQQFLRTSPALSESSAAWMHHAGHRFHEVFQVRQGRYADLSPSKISEMMKSTSLDNAPTQSLLSVVNGILDESIERKNGEIPHRVACLLRKVVQEIERRISTQAEHLRTQNNLFKAREEKYQSRIRVLETLASGSGEETVAIMDQLPPIKGVKVKIEEKSKVNDEIVKLMKEKEQTSLELARLRQELETTKTIYDDMVKLVKEKDSQAKIDQLSSSKLEQKQVLEMAALQQELAAGKKELNGLVDSMKANDQPKNEQTSAEVLGLQQEVALSRKKLDEMVSSRKEANQVKNEQTNAEVVALQQELALSRKELDDMVSSRKEKVQLESEQRNDKVLELQRELALSRKNLDDMVSSRKETNQVKDGKTSSEVLALQQELALARKQLDDMVRSMKQKDQGKKNEEANAEVLALQQELALARKQLDDMVSSMKEKDQRGVEKEIGRTRQGDEVHDEVVVRLVKEKEEMGLQLMALKQELERVKGSGNVDNDDDGVVRLVEEKEEISRQLATMKQELERVKLEQGNVDNDDEVVRLVKEKEEMDLKLSALQQELEIARQGRNNDDDMARLMKENEEMGLKLSALQQELEISRKGNGDDDDEMTRLMKEKEEMSLKLSALEQELERTRKGQDNDQARFLKEKEEISTQLSNLQQEHEEMIRSMKEKDQMSQKLQQELEASRKEHEDESTRLQGEIESTRKELDDTNRLVKEKDQANLRLAMSMQELEAANKAQEQKCLGFEKRIEELDGLLEDSRDKFKGLEGTLERKEQSWSKKQNCFLKSVNLQFHSLHELRFSSTSIKEEVLQVQQDYTEKFLTLGVKFKTLVDASENYYLVLAENRRLFNELQDLRGNIRVYCRVRPFLPGQSTTNKSIVEHIGDKGELVVGNPVKTGKDARKLFRFNKVYGPEATQAEVYLDTQPLVQSVLDGYNVCIFAYGQTGSGKTYTMLGPNGAKEDEWGVNYRALKDLFNMSKSRSDSISYEVGVQMVEIYNEQVRDLLTNDPQKKLGILTTTPSNGIAVPDATMLPVSSTSDVMDLMQIGLNNRAVSATALNERSSRSHSVLSVHVKGKDLQAGTSLFGNLHLVDLAGSERIDRSEVTGDRLKEAQHINKSLSALGDVIFALAQKSTHVPYRNSKLTQLLQSSLGGQAKTLMFVQLNPDATSYSESLSTLKFAERVTGIELGAAKSNPGRDVKELMEQLASLKDTIANKDEEIERLQVLRNNGNPARLRLTETASDHGDSERYSDFSDGEASVGTEPESVHDDGGGGKGTGERLAAARGTRGLTKARSLQKLSDSRSSPSSTTVTVSRDHLKGSTSVKKTTSGAAGAGPSTLQKSTSSSRSRRT